MVQSVCEAVEEVLVLELVVEKVKESSAPSNWGIVGVRVSRTPTPSPRVSLLHSWAVEGGKVVSGRPDGGGWVLDCVIMPNFESTFIKLNGSSAGYPSGVPRTRI